MAETTTDLTAVQTLIGEVRESLAVPPSPGLSWRDEWVREKFAALADALSTALSDLSTLQQENERLKSDLRERDEWFREYNKHPKEEVEQALREAERRARRWREYAKSRWELFKEFSTTAAAIIKRLEDRESTLLCEVSQARQGERAMRERAALAVEQALVLHGDQHYSYQAPSNDAPELAKAIRALPEAAPASCCEWREVREDYWHTDCGADFCIAHRFGDETTRKFCGYCGRPLKAIPYQPEVK